MKYVVVKGYLGFGDRLETLKMAVAYALNNNLQIYVDWRDKMWSHGSENFYTYFNLVNMPVLKSLDDIPADATYYPALWKGRIHEHISPAFFDAHSKEGLDLGIIQDKTFPADVVVVSSIGMRMLYPNCQFFANVFKVVDRRILTALVMHKTLYPLEKSWGIHIRGTDHVHARKRSLCIQSIVSNITANGGLNQPHMVAVSDDAEQLEIWKRFYPDTYLVSQPKVASLKGTHNLASGELGISKDTANVEALIDFFVLASCYRIFSTVKGSRFTAEAQRLHPFVSMITGV
jgi:hypothetical protein